MTQLELRLVALRDCVDFPPTPDLAPRVRERLAETGATPRRGLSIPWTLTPRVALAGVLAALIVGLGLTMAVSPSARSAILRWLGIEGVSITRVQTLPPTQAGTDLSLGPRFTLAEAREQVRFPVVVPRALGTPDEVHVLRGIPGRSVFLVYRAGPGRPQAGPSGVSVLLTQFRGDATPYIQKMVSQGTRVRNVTVLGAPGYVITGPLHTVVFRDRGGEVRQDRPRLATNTLLFERDGVTLRLEADLPAARLVAIANSVR